jgi:signal transduction histidine kinase
VHSCLQPVVAQSKNVRLLPDEQTKILNLIARANTALDAQNDSCLIFANQALSLAKANRSAELEARAVEVISDHYRQQEEYRKAIFHQKRLVDLYSFTGDSTKKAFMLNRLGVSYFNIGIYDESSKSLHKAIELALLLRDKKLIASCHQNLGVLYAQLLRYKEAGIHYEKALNLYRSLNLRRDEAGILQNLGILADEENHHKEALGYYLSALEIYKKSADSISIGEMYLNLGSLYEEQAEYSKSLVYYRKAVPIFENKDYKFGMAYVYFSLGSVYRKTRAYKEALNMLQKSLSLSRQIALVENEADCHRELAEVNYGLGDYMIAYEEFKDFEILRDSLFNEKVQQSILETEMRFKTQMKDREIEGLIFQKHKVHKDLIRRTIGSAAIISLTLIVIVIVIYYSKTLKTANKQLTAEIEERLRVEKELISMKEHLEERVVKRTQELERALIKAEESDRLKTAFVANMSHEIRTPLNAITGFSGLLLRKDIHPDKRKDFADQIIKNNRILVNMIEDLIDTSKIESGSLQLHPSRIHLSHFICQLKEPMVENMIRRNKPFLELIQDDNPLGIETFMADPVRLQQIIMHLVDNAIKFTQNGSIHYGVKENKHHIEFYVEDTGPGIPLEFQELIFEKFRQLDESVKRTYGGTGLGLYYARKIAEIMNGKLGFENKLEGGSRFVLSLPKGIS